MYSTFTTYTQYRNSIQLEVEPHQHMQMQIFPVHHGQQRGIADTQFAGNAENCVSSKRLEETVSNVSHP